MLESHYAPRARVRLGVSEIESGEAALLFGKDAPRGVEAARVALNLSENGDLVEAAARLFSYLRQLDASSADVIAVGPIPDAGLGEAINDRLARAAAGR
jgi:L-threonylcarbamoyladenylate synthase